MIEVSKCKNKKYNLKCCTCEHYDKKADFCTEKEIENCSKQVNTDFSRCEDYLISEKLVMY